MRDLLARTVRHRDALDRDLQAGDTDAAIGERGNLTVKRLRAQPRGPDVDELAREIANQLPVIDLPDLLIEVDRWTRFTRHLTHAGGATPRREDHARLLFAALIAQACNLGAGRMARASDLSPAQVGWTSEWYLRRDTLERATAAIVEHQSHHRAGPTDGQRRALQQRRQTPPRQPRQPTSPSATGGGRGSQRRRRIGVRRLLGCCRG
ncbi:MAG TPA: Tn3 family transposase [Solirubrobacteraceae bacterium]|nr:Tn3 family transposase [Solirubrobacteraceae bacterium]